MIRGEIPTKKVYEDDHVLIVAHVPPHLEAKLARYSQ